MNEPESSATRNSGAPTGMLEEPSLSRQWVARRLQRALTVERWLGPVRTGLGRRGGELGALLTVQGDAAARRAAVVKQLIGVVGAVPYGSWGIAAPLVRGVSTAVGLLSARLSRYLARLIAEHTLSEYRALEAFVQDAPGVPADLADRVAPLHAEARAELQALAVSHS